jgi:hypothetical protein
VVWLALLSASLRSDDIRKTHLWGLCAVFKSMWVIYLAMRLTFEAYADVWRVNGACRDGGELQYNSC